MEYVLRPALPVLDRGTVRQAPAPGARDAASGREGDQRQGRGVADLRERRGVVRDKAEVRAERPHRAAEARPAAPPRRGGEGRRKGGEGGRARRGPPPEGTGMTISRMLYVDDSGAVDHGLIVYGWIEVAPDRWRHGLGTILELRKQLYRDHHVPPATELHATKFVNG